VASEYYNDSGLKDMILKNLNVKIAIDDSNVDIFVPDDFNVVDSSY